MAADDITIRRIEPGDASLLREVRLRMLLIDPSSFASTHAHEAALEEAHWAERARKLSTGDNGAQLLALDETGPVGAVVAIRDDDEPALFHIYAMWVSPERRGAGLGARLLAEAEAWIVAAGGREAELSVTNAAPHAARLYARAGYEPDGTETPSRHTPGLIEHSLRKRL
jgi:ribosomal protein S18 acetylase RimI-like enzyme